MPDYQKNPLTTTGRTAIVPIVDEYWSSLDPLGLFTALADDPSLFWLDSGNASHGWSYIGVNPSIYLPAPDFFQIPASPPALSNTMDLNRPPFTGGWVVKISYPDDCAIPLSQKALASLTQAHFYETVFAYSHAGRFWLALTNPRLTLSSRAVLQKAKDAVTRSRAMHKNSALKNPGKNAPPVTLSKPRTYIESVGHALNYIKAGDIYQVNIAQYFDVTWRHSSAELYLRMRRQSPPAYGAFLGSEFHSDQRSICCISPELFLQVREGCVLTRPIKGTRPLGNNAQGMRAARRDLDTSPKERAELNMIVDLERNDLGRVCSYGSIKVASAGEIEELPTLLHRTATVTGRLRTGTTIGELLAATFPGGSVTGAPKLRAMQIISELEGFARGPYCGAIGWIGTNGNMELNIAIRTAVCDTARGTARYFAGSGIVADSDPKKEFNETLLKAAPFFSAVQGR